MSARCAASPRKRPNRCVTLTVAKGHWLTLLNDLIGEREYFVRNGETERFGRSEIENKIKFGRLSRHRAALWARWVDSF